MKHFQDTTALRRLGICTMALFLFAATACSDDLILGGEDVDGSGTIVAESRDVAGFDKVTLAGEGTVILDEGQDVSLTVETDDNLLVHIETTVSNNTLTIATERGIDIDPSAYVIYRVTAPDITGLTLTGAGSIELSSAQADRFTIALTGAGDIEIDDLQADDLDVQITGVGSVVLAGHARFQDVNLSGTGDYRGRDLESERAAVATTGVGSATVWVTGELDATVTGVGSINYYGSPVVMQSVTGIGSVNARGDA